MRERNPKNTQRSAFWRHKRKLCIEKLKCWPHTLQICEIHSNCKLMHIHKCTNEKKNEPLTHAKSSKAYQSEVWNWLPSLELNTHATVTVTVNNNHKFDCANLTAMCQNKETHHLQQQQQQQPQRINLFANRRKVMQTTNTQRSKKVIARTRACVFCLFTCSGNGMNSSL